MHSAVAFATANSPQSFTPFCWCMFMILTGTFEPWNVRRSFKVSLAKRPEVSESYTSMQSGLPATTVQWLPLMWNIWTYGTDTWLSECTVSVSLKPSLISNCRRSNVCTAFICLSVNSLPFNISCLSLILISIVSTLLHVLLGWQCEEHFRFCFLQWQLSLQPFLHIHFFLDTKFGFSLLAASLRPTLFVQVNS